MLPFCVSSVGNGLLPGGKATPESGNCLFRTLSGWRGCVCCGGEEERESGAELDKVLER